MSAHFFLGVDVGGTNAKLAVLSGGDAVATKTIATRSGEGPDALFDRVGIWADSVTNGRKNLTAVGVGCAGLVSRAGELQTSPNLPGWQGVRLAQVSQKRLGVAAVVDNDVNAAAYGELYKGCAKESKMFVLITLGTGVGGGIVCNRKILRGVNNYAGELGHMTINDKGPLCTCGNRGCLEAYLGAQALVRHAKSLLRRRRGRVLSRLVAAGTPLDPKAIAQAARQNDDVAKIVFETAAERLGVALASLVNLLNPDIIALGGGVAGGFGLMKAKLNEVVRKQAFDPSADGVVIRKAQLGNKAASIGAALLARDSLKNKEQSRG